MQNKPSRFHEDRGDAVVKRVSRRQDEEDHGGAWKVAFADFCLALMCLFLVLWVMAARQQERIQEVLRSPGGSLVDDGQGVMPETAGGPRGSLIERYAVLRRADHSTSGNDVAHGGGEPNDPVQGPFAPKVRYETRSDLEELSRLLSRLSAEAGLAANLQAIVTLDGLRVLLHDTERNGVFARGSWVPNERFGVLLRRMGPLFARMENQMLIVGHTDSVPYSDRSHGAFSNWTLSSNRAMAARAQLLAGGMRADSVLQVIGMADRAPLDTRNAGAGVNRRIEFLILTTQQAGAITAMFGVPGKVRPLIDGADLVVRNEAATNMLRAQLVTAQGGDARSD